jgi:hypothetical protein
MAKQLSIGRIGSSFDGKINKGVIYRMNRAPQAPVNYPYLVVSENIDDLPHIDILTMKDDVRNVKDRITKKARKGIGLEIVIAPARKMDAGGAGRWFAGIQEMHTLCDSLHCQLILSSGATAKQEMVAGPCLDAILKICGIDPQRHWDEMNEWLEARLSRRVSV